MKQSMIVGLMAVALMLMPPKVINPQSIVEQQYRAMGRHADARNQKRVEEMRVQTNEMRLLRQQLGHIAQDQAQGTNAVQRVAYLEQSVAAYGDNVAQILQAQDRALQQIASDIWGLHERILRLEAGLAMPQERPAQQARNPRTPD